jgi:hypothetical protein
MNLNVVGAGVVHGGAHVRRVSLNGINLAAQRSHGGKTEAENCANDGDRDCHATERSAEGGRGNFHFDSLEAPPSYASWMRAIARSNAGIAFGRDNARFGLDGEKEK